MGGGLGRGIDISFATNNVVVGNIIGTSPGQITDPPFKFQRLGNSGSGIVVENGADNTIGGASTGSGTAVEPVFFFFFRKKKRIAFRSPGKKKMTSALIDVCTLLCSFCA